jgi:hypothetical protein
MIAAVAPRFASVMVAVPSLRRRKKWWLIQEKLLELDARQLAWLELEGRRIPGRSCRRIQRRC